ncbi:MAG: rhodanese-like domain-containing protein [Proteobacteria bacterium]|jgi:rhodanese-related sulfurtransferase|nr:rhodanese-like domain-containing protein [Pseudomonadota bacterium]MDA1238364.1 rhodanese-like domain-containing protein [Pseudomonadota bacterium]
MRIFKSFFSNLTLLLAVGLLNGSASASNGAAAIGITGLTFEQSKHLQMMKEVLKISHDLIDAQKPTALGQVTPKEFLEMQSTNSIVIDIRREDEWIKTGIIKGAKTITAFTDNGEFHVDFQEQFFALINNPDTPILLYCRTGNRSGMLGNALIEQVGLKNVFHLTDGIVGWKKFGHETINYASN